MNLENLQQKFTTVAITLIGVLAGVYCGRVAGNGELNTLAYLGALIAVTLVCLVMKTRIWFLIPLAWDLKSKSYLLPLPFGVRDVTIVLSFGMFLFFTAFKLLRRKPTHSLLDFLLGINLLYLLTVYIRNPVGVSALNTDLVGGRPYYLTIIAFCGYWVLSRVVVSPLRARRIPILILVSAIIVGSMSVVAYLVPATVPVLSHIYSGVETSSYEEGAENFSANSTDNSQDSVSGRIGSLLDFGGITICVLCALYPAITLVNPLYIWRFGTFVIAWLAILVSGHRAGVIIGLSTILISSYFRRGILELFKLLALFLPLLVVLILAQGTLFELPLVAQRALSFLPGNWNQVAVRNAQDSSEWRYEIWRTALKGNRYIKNKILGDGFGVSQKALDDVAAHPENNEEGQLIAGGFHSGPLSAVRFVGIVGMIFYYVLIIYLAYRAAKLIRECEGTPYYSLALFFGVPIFFEPFFYTFVFGGYDSDLPQTILSVGMVKLIHESVKDYKKTTEEDIEVEPASELKKYIRVAPANA